MKTIAYHRVCRKCGHKGLHPISKPQHPYVRCPKCKTYNFEARTKGRPHEPMKSEFGDKKIFGGKVYKLRAVGGGGRKGSASAARFFREFGKSVKVVVYSNDMWHVFVR